MHAGWLLSQRFKECYGKILLYASKKLEGRPQPPVSCLPTGQEKAPAVIR